MSLPARRTSRTTLAITATLPLLLATAGWGQGLPPIQREFSNGATLRFYGQINKGVLNYDDGIDSETYGLIDNDNSSTRVGLRYNQDFGAWHFENVNEFDYAPFSTDNTSIIHQSPDSEDWEFSNGNIRKLDFTLANDRYGKFWLGQGSMATDGIYEIDLSGTDRHRLFQRRRQRLGADHPLQRPGPRLRREPERHHHRRRLHQLRRRPPGAHPLRHARLQRLHRRRRLRPQPAERRSGRARREHLRRLGHLRAHLRRRRGRGRARLLLGRGRHPQLGRLGLGAAHADRPQRHPRRRRPGHRRRRRQLLVRQARAPARLRRLGRHRGRRSTTIPATTSSSTPTPASPARRATRSACRWCRTSTGPTPSSGSPTAPTTTRTTPPATRRSGDLRRRALQVLIPASTRGRTSKVSSGGQDRHERCQLLREIRRPQPVRDQGRADAAGPGRRPVGPGVTSTPAAAIRTGSRRARARRSSCSASLR